MLLSFGSWLGTESRAFNSTASAVEMNSLAITAAKAEV